MMWCSARNRESVEAELTSLLVVWSSVIHRLPHAFQPPVAGGFCHCKRVVCHGSVAVILHHRCRPAARIKRPDYIDLASIFNVFGSLIQALESTK